MDDEKISLRISKEELHALDLYLEKHPELGSRSLFIKNAIRNSLDRDAQAEAEKQKGREVEAVDGIVVKLPPYLEASVNALAQTMYNSPGEYICELIRRDLDADGQKARDVSNRAIFVATSGISP